MIIGKLIKPCKICFYQVNQEGGEIESYSLLKLSLPEFTALLNEAAHGEKPIECTCDDSVVIQYSGDDKVHKLWKETAFLHEKQNPSEFLDVSAQWKSDIAGTSCLIRDPKNHIIRIAKRDGNDKTTINRMCIDNGIRERFFYDVKTTKLHGEKHNFAMDTRDLNIYTYWSRLMNTSYIAQYRLQKQKKVN